MPAPTPDTEATVYHSHEHGPEKMRGRGFVDGKFSAEWMERVCTAAEEDLPAALEALLPEDERVLRDGSASAILANRPATAQGEQVRERLERLAGRPARPAPIVRALDEPAPHELVHQAGDRRSAGCSGGRRPRREEPAGRPRAPGGVRGKGARPLPRTPSRRAG